MPKQNNVKSRILHFPAATGGWNQIDNLAAMEPTDAVQLDNLFPEPTYLRLRLGSQLYANIGGTTPVRSLMTYASASRQRMLAACAGQLYDVTTGTPASIGSGYTSDKWEYVNFATPGGQYWVGVNATAQQLVWDGTANPPAWATNTWGTGTVSSNFSMVAAFQNRLFFCGDANLWLYWLPVTTYQGQIDGMDLGGFLPNGGQIADIGTWTRDDAFQGMNDLLVIVTTLGEVLTYSGVNPEDSANWNMVGRFEIGDPVGGHRALQRLGPDMMLICEDGFQSLANYLSLGVSKALVTQISRKIGNAVSAAVRANRLAEGWDAVLWPNNNALIVNVPTVSAGFQQYVVNTITGSWCRFIGMSAWSWCVYADGLYFGSDNGAVVQASVGADDQGNPIKFELVSAFQVPEQDPSKKRVTMCRPYLIANGQVLPVMVLTTYC